MKMGSIGANAAAEGLGGPVTIKEESDIAMASASQVMHAHVFNGIDAAAQFCDLHCECATSLLHSFLFVRALTGKS